MNRITGRVVGMPPRDVRERKCSRCENWFEPRDEGDPNGSVCSACLEEDELREQVRIAVTEALVDLSPAALAPEDVWRVILDEVLDLRGKWKAGEINRFYVARRDWFRRNGESPETVRAFYQWWDAVGRDDARLP